ncbi:unnamed protein product [Callosobruchus maculatus]|uniref:Uncharacterized protein n=1 Tax=Callosobruchus maculatus TaxID=64391 RepID=A0A653DRL7_CALMS|nr:unnamed protein product [Callosobruchus maculatus]
MDDVRSLLVQLGLGHLISRFEVSRTQTGRQTVRQTDTQTDRRK